VDEDERLDCLYRLREECETQVSRTIRWLDEHLDTFKRKLKTLGNYNMQLLQSKRE
jgi:ActR/RegA family two-component response regulator